MGDRVLFQVKSGEKFSPVAYGHWSGSSAPRACRALERRMDGRPDDVEYAFARLVQILVGEDDGNTGFGCRNATKVLTAADSHGDAGCVIIDVSKPRFVFACVGGYMVVGKDGYPVSKYDVAEETK